MSKVFGSNRPKDAPPRKKRVPQPIRGILNFVNEEGAAAREDYEAIRKLKKKPKY